MRVSRSFCRAFASLSFGLVLAACPPPDGQDAGLADDAGEVIEDGGSPVDGGAGDASQPPPTDGGGGGSIDCPVFNPLAVPVGQACAQEGLVCGAEGCIAPGPGQCPYIVCQDGTWQDYTAPDDGGPGDAGGDAGDPDAGSTDAGDAGAESDGAASDAGQNDGSAASASDAAS